MTRTMLALLVALVLAGTLAAQDRPFLAWFGEPETHAGDDACWQRRIDGTRMCVPMTRLLEVMAAEGVERPGVQDLPEFRQEAAIR